MRRTKTATLLAPRVGAFFLFAAILGSAVDASAVPTVQNITTVIPIDHSTPIGASSSTAFNLPDFDNERGVLRDIYLNLGLGITLRGTFSNSSQIATGDVIATITSSVTMLPTSMGIAQPGEALLHYPLDCEVGPCHPFTLPNYALPVGPLVFDFHGQNYGLTKQISGPFDITWQTTMTPGSGTFVGAIDFRGQATVTYAYDAKTSYGYAQDTIAMTRDLVADPHVPDTDIVEYGRAMYSAAIHIRESENNGEIKGPSNYNQNIKVVEYYTRGLAGGILWHNLGDHDRTFNDFANVLMPWSSLFYIGGKKLLDIAGISQVVRPDASLVNFIEDHGTANQGFWDGVLGTFGRFDDVDSAVLSHFSQSSMRKMQAQATGSVVESITLPPGLTTDDGRAVAARIFAIQAIDQASGVAIDSEGCEDLIFAFSGGTLLTLLIELEEQPGKALTFYGDDGEISFLEGVTLDLREHGLSSGAARFALSASEGNGPMKLTFGFGDTSRILIAELRVSPVPEPCTYALFSLGLLFLVCVVRRRAG